MENYQLRNLDRGHVTLFGEVDDDRVQSLIEQFLYLERRRNLREITLWINSAGGLLQPAFGLADVLEVLDKPVRTIGLGTVESAATVLLMAGTRGRRLMTRNASMMIHEYSWSNSGSVTEMEGRLTEIKNTARKQIEHLVHCSGKTEVEIRKLLRHQETWLNPQQAIDWGLVDAVLDFNPAAKAGVPKRSAATKARAKGKSKGKSKGKGKAKKSSKKGRKG